MKAEVGAIESPRPRVREVSRAYLSTVELFGALMELAPGHQSADVEEVFTQLKNRETQISATVNFDYDGLLSFNFYSVKHGEAPRLILNATPNKRMSG